MSTWEEGLRKFVDLERAVESADLRLESAIAFDKTQPSFKGIKQLTDHERVSSFDVVLQLRSGAGTNGHADVRPAAERDQAVAAAVDDLLGSAPPRHRTTPYVHSFVMRFLLEKGWPLRGYSYQAVEDLLVAQFDFRNGAWNTRLPENQQAGRDSHAT